MLKRDINILDDLIVCGVGSGEVDGAWVRIKKVLEESAKQTDNTASTKCSRCINQITDCMCAQVGAKCKFSPR